MKPRPLESLADILMIVVSPALIMFMVGSLIFFLTHMSYDGEFPFRLRFACAMFVMAAVLITRIAIDDGREYALWFALPLSIVTLMSISRYTDAGPLVTIPLIAFIWWSTDKLTWDCTVIDNAKDASGEGLLQTIGLDAGTESAGDDKQGELIDAEATTDSVNLEQMTLWQRWLARRRRHHTPGVWVVYFGLAAIPLFGLGQLLIPEHARGAAFLLLCIYLASALALLMSTSFLQMRRYLIQRNLPLTHHTAATWLGSGGVIIVVLMMLCLMLPRPNTGYSMLDTLSPTGSRGDLQASRNSWGDEGVEDHHAQGRATVDSSSEQQGNAVSNEKHNDQQPGAPAESSKSGTGRQQSGSSGKDNSQNSQQQNSQQQNSQASEKAGTQSSSDPAQRNEESGGKSSGSKPVDKRAGQSQQMGDDNSRHATDAPQDQTPSERTPQKPQKAEGAEGAKTILERMMQDRNLSLPQLPDMSLGGIAKWIYLVLIAAGVVFVLVSYGGTIAKSIAAFWRELLSFIARLFGGGGSTEDEIETAEPTVALPKLRPFGAFADPFSSGQANVWTPPQLIQYSFEALQAWAQERDCGRVADQTPLEFATQLGGVNERIGAAARNLAILYNQVAYAPGAISEDSTDHVRHLWRTLHEQRVASRPA